jgi:t-SNARE complex subunit (syntaxin)
MKSWRKSGAAREAANALEAAEATCKDIYVYFDDIEKVVKKYEEVVERLQSASKKKRQTKGPDGMTMEGAASVCYRKGRVHRGSIFTPLFCLRGVVAAVFPNADVSSIILPLLCRQHAML